MPNKANAKKSLRQAKKKTARNLVFKNAYKVAVKTALKELSAGGKEMANSLRAAQKALDKAAQKGIIKKNTAARKLSRLAAKLKKSS